MKNHNIQRLLDASPFINHISDGTYDALFDYLLEIDATLDNINIDDIIVNSIYEMSIGEFNDSYNEHDVYILYKDEDEDIISFFN